MLSSKSFFQNIMNQADWKVNSMMEFDHYQNIARAAFGDMLYDDERVSSYLLKLFYTMKDEIV